MNTTSWTLWLFDARVIGGWGLGDTFARGLYPLLIELLLLLIILISFLR
ncbi:MAG: hypothetical protein R3C11_26635 [Planctomycetaceae bacterium]